MTKRSQHEVTAREAIEQLSVSAHPCSVPVIEFIRDGMRQGQYTKERADSLVELAASAERQQRNRLRQARELMGRTA